VGVREMLARLSSGGGAYLRHRARSEAERLFSIERVANLTLDALFDAAGLERASRSGGGSA